MRKMAKNVPKMVGAMENDLIIGSLPVKQSRKKKQKKWTERELMNQWSEEESYLQFGDNREITKPYENISYMSQTEKNRFEEKFHKPKNDSQTRYSHLLRNKAKKIVVANGPAGTGKTLFATEYGIRNFFTHQYEKIVFTRPSVSVDEDLGYLPGTLEEKMAPWVRYFV
jgi:predicted ribonuclease YlaK